MRAVIGFLIIFWLLAFPLGFFLSGYLPWWTFVVLAFVLGLAMRISNGGAFLAGLLGGAVLWGLSAWIVEMGGNPAFTDQMAAVLNTSGGGFVYGLTIILGGLLGGLGAWSGALLKRAVRPQKRTL